MRAIDAAQLIVNRLSRTGKSVDRNDLTKMLYLLDLTVLKHTFLTKKFRFSLSLKLKLIDKTIL